MEKLYLFFYYSLALLLATNLAGCGAHSKNINPEKEYHYDASYDFADKKQIVNRLTGPLITASFLADRQSPPLMIVYPLVNETSEHIDTGAISDALRMELLKSGRYRFINERQRQNIILETTYQNKGYVSPEMRIEQGRQLGADYILSGTLRSIKSKEQRQWRLSKEERIYYSLDLTLTDLNSSEIIYADQAEIARQASRPIIGW